MLAAARAAVTDMTGHRPKAILTFSILGLETNIDQWATLLPNRSRSPLAGGTPTLWVLKPAGCRRSGL